MFICNDESVVDKKVHKLLPGKVDKVCGLYKHCMLRKKLLKLYILNLFLYSNYCY